MTTKIRILLLLFLFSFMSAAFGGTAPPATGPVVSTTGGAVQGKHEGSVDAFLGIPYAKPPVGELRWRAPVNAEPWTGVRDATRFCASCIQIARPGDARPFTQEFLAEPPFSEDCLYLNVWTPAKRSKPLPVFVWIHGGAFTGGSGSLSVHNGANLASQGAVIVTINYRLGVLGFLAHPELTQESADGTSGNYGMRDMIEALKWVKANIARFGGDSENVTIGGQSAGSAAVNNLVMSPMAKGLFQRVIPQSGSGMGIGMGTLKEAEATGVEFAKELGASSIADLRKMPTSALWKKEDEPGVMGDKSRRSYRPSVDGIVLAGDPNDPTAPVQSRVPLMTGYTADESDPSVKTTVAEFEKMIRQSYGSFAEKFLAAYPHGDDAQASHSAVELTRDRYMASLVIWSESRAETSGTPVYTYLFDHPYPGPYASTYGTFHTAEVPYTFGALNTPGLKFTDRDRQVSREMQTYWLKFFSTGNPNGSNLPVWPTVTAAPGEVMGIGDTPGRRLAVSTQERLSLFRDYVAAGGKLSRR